MSASPFRASAKDNWSAVQLPVRNFGDGTNPQTGARVTHTYTQPGTYTVTVTDSDAVENTASVSKSITISAST